jgi:transforming growth factor-beta-induced protein
LSACSSTSTGTTAASAPATKAPSASAPTTAAPAAGKDIVDTAVGAGQFTTLAKLLTSAGLVDTLKGAGPFTVFAPTDDAFKAVPAATLDAIAKDPAKLKAVLTYHVVAGKVMAADVKTGTAKSVEGEDLNLKAEGGKVMVNDATVVTADVAASNGVIHVIDKVLLPPSIAGADMAAPTTAMAAPTTAAPALKDIVDTAVAAGSFTTLAKLLTAAGLVDTLKGAGPFTVFAPTDDAFKAVPQATLDALAKDPAKLKAVLTYHVVAGKVLAADVKTGAAMTVEGQNLNLTVTGGKVMVNDATVIKADVLASNGVIHVIDKVLLPPSN